MNNRSFNAVLVGAFTALTGAMATQAVPATGLFPENAAVTAPPAYGRAALAAEIDTTGIARGRKFLLLKLPEGGTVKLERTHFEDRAGNSALWRGRSAAHELSQAVLTLRKGNVSGRVVLESETYEIKPGTGSLHTLVLLDQDAFPDCDTADHDIVDGGGSGTAASSEQGGSVIDLLAVYTANVVSDSGGIDQAEARIQAAVDNANTAFAESDMDVQYRLVHTQQVSYNDAPDTGTALSWVRNDAEVAALRDQYGADMVSVIVDTPSSCGTGYVQRNPGPGFASAAFQATDIDCAVGNLTFAHEHGHNAGMEHNPLNSSVGSTPEEASYPYSFGHYINGSYRTVMSYSNPCTSGCSRVARHSSASIVYNGVATGIANQRENARTGNNTAPIIAEFRDTVVGGAPVVNVRISQSLDDIEESTTNGSILTDSTDLEFGHDSLVGSEQLLGLRFLDIDIPQGATITSAYLGFTVDETGSATTTASIRALDADSAAPFTTGAYSLSSRAATGQVNWTIPAWDTTGEYHQSPDISALVQAVVNRAGWAPGNAMGFTIAAMGDRTAEAWDGVSSSAPLLHVEYDVDAPPPAPNQAPSASFSHTVNDLAVSFTDTSSDSDGSIAGWDWDFGDGGSSSAASPDHTYSAAGNYTVTLTVTDDDGASDSSSASVTVTEPVTGLPPTAPYGLSVKDGTDGTAQLSWNDTSDNEEGFEITRQFQHKNGSWRGTTTITVDPDATGHTDSSGTGTFRYQVRAYNSGGQSAPTVWQEVTVTSTSGGGGGGGSKPCKGKRCG
jgi:PKD repeat protein